MRLWTNLALSFVWLIEPGGAPPFGVAPPLVLCALDPFVTQKCNLMRVRGVRHTLFAALSYLVLAKAQVRYQS